MSDRDNPLDVNGPGIEDEKGSVPGEQSGSELEKSLGEDLDPSEKELVDLY